MNEFDRAAEVIANADTLFIGAGAGMGVDSGLPDFRGDQGFWRAYPPFKELGLSFIDLANPRWFADDPGVAWGFYGHRLNLYRDTVPHAGFDILKRWGARLPHGAFVFTSNVDGQFQRAGFPDDQVFECHGSIHHLQCCVSCDDAIWPADAIEVDVDEYFRAADPLPTCPSCTDLARPNILMFGDAGWVETRAVEKQQRMRDWLASVKRPAVVECGAGTAVPSVRWQCERVASAFDVPIIRINPREAHGPAGTISIATTALQALAEIDDRLG